MSRRERRKPGQKSVEAGYAKDELLTIEVTVKYSQLHIDKSAQNASFNGMHDRGKLPCRWAVAARFLGVDSPVLVH